MKVDNVFDNDFLNHKFNKDNIYKAYLCELVISEGYLQVIAIDEVVGIMKNDLFFDFNGGNIWNLLEINDKVKYNFPGKYVVSPTRVYDKKGRIRPIDVLCDIEREKEDIGIKEAKGKRLRKVFTRK